MRNTWTETDVAERANPTLGFLRASSSGSLYGEFDTVFDFGASDTGADTL